MFGFSMRPIKSLALQEPLVDSVSHECVNTTTDKLISIDINKMTADDIPFDSEFELRATRNDHIHALCLWFDIFFDCSHKPVRFYPKATGHEADGLSQLPSPPNALHIMTRPQNVLCSVIASQISVCVALVQHVAVHEADALEAVGVLSEGHPDSVQGRSHPRKDQVHTQQQQSSRPRFRVGVLL